jgi:hypothetical protein
MKLWFLGFLLLAHPAFAEEAPFHPPQTGAEKALNEIFQLYGKDSDLGGYISGYPWYKHDKDEKFSLLVSKDFVEKSTKEEKRLIAESCGGKYPANGLPCDMLGGTHPIYCAQDRPDVFFYRTIRSSENEALVTYAWAEDETDGPAYLLVREKDGWKLDAVYCDWAASKKPVTGPLDGDR